MKLFTLTILISLLLMTDNALAQEHGHHPSMTADTMMHEGHEMSMPMSHAFSRNLPMSRNGSGTGWLPDASPMHGYMLHSENWMYMIHGNVFLRYNNQDIGNEGSRGDTQFGSVNWIMGMGQTKVGARGLFRFSTMISFESLTIGGAGYPLLFQSGETWEGEPLVDHQHPHDLISELSIAYTHMISEDMDAFVYLGYPGEPALGPVAFMHRPSAIVNPDTPIGHHWQDATHVTFGVATLGFRYKNFKLDGSLFTGTEPDEDRYGFDEPRFNAWSARLSYNPSPYWALQVSRGWLNDVHAIGSREDLNRTTASAIHSVQLGAQTFLNSTILWGYNQPQHDDHPSSHSFLLESALRIHNTTLYGKYEWVEKSTEDLQLDEDVYDHGSLFPVNAFTLGIQQKLIKTSDTNLSFGVQGSLYITPDQLEQIYGQSPVALEIYLRIYPGLMGSGADG